jgi:AmpD protein
MLYQQLTVNNDGWLKEVTAVPTSHYNSRPESEISLIVIHNISLPPGIFLDDHISDFFCGKLDARLHPYFKEICTLQVSSHCLIRRSGEIIQYVSFLNRAWHAGKSLYKGREACNDFSIGIELEGTDNLPYTIEQYKNLALLTKLLITEYREITKERITGHSDIAPKRKTDPGLSFDWNFYFSLLSK